MPYFQQTPASVAVLTSGGLDSAILLAHLAESGHTVQPIYVAMGCAWDTAERQAVNRFTNALDAETVLPVVELGLPVADLYGDHWSITCENVPGESTPDEAVFLWGRNPLLLLKPALWCQKQGIRHLALGPLASNPFADATEEFFEQFTAALVIATEQELEIVRPFAQFSKQEVLELGAHLPLELTFSCLAPQRGLHCGRCNKCAERTRALGTLAGGDPTVYAESSCVEAVD